MASADAHIRVGRCPDLSWRRIHVEDDPSPTNGGHEQYLWMVIRSPEWIAGYARKALDQFSTKYPSLAPNAATNR